MKELADAISEITETPARRWACPGLQVAAHQWAVHALDTYTDSLLDSALAVSAALAKFNFEVEGVTGDEES